MQMMFFYFLKIIFNISTSKRFKKYKPYSILTKKNSKFNETQIETHSQTVYKRELRFIEGCSEFAMLETKFPPTGC